MRTLRINLDAIVHNLDVMRARASQAKVMGVVKANAYGHGAIEVARTLERAGVDYLGVADVDEALALREAGIATPILAWLHDPSDDFVAAISASIDLGVANRSQLARISAAAAITGVVAKLHLKIDTGLGRNGSTEAEWLSLLEEVKALGEAVSVVGIFSHLSTTSREEDLAQIEKFDSAVAEVKKLGISFELRHLTASDGSLAYPEAHYEMVRIGVALYGLDPFSTNRAAEYGLIPAMTAVSTVVQVKTVPAGHGVSYNFLLRTKSETNLALIPVGYAEGLPRAASGKAEVFIGGKRYPILSQVAMDQFVLDIGNDPIQVGDEVIIFGDGATGAPSADDLAAAVGTINYEIVTRMGGRFKREYFGAGL
jgi:alanine racemase